MVWATAGDKAAVIFVGTKGIGDTWYGNEQGPCLECDNRGWWATGFEGQFVVYDPNDLAKVAAGNMQPYEPQPYATLNVDQYLYHITSSQQKHHLGAACFDRSMQYLYVFEVFADGDEKDRPIVHVWEILSTSSPEPDIKANGSNGPISVSLGIPISVSVSLNPGNSYTQSADWWIAAHSPFGWYTYSDQTGWQPEVYPYDQIPLTSLPSVEVLNAFLPAGNYTFYFALDSNMDGVPDATWYDSVDVQVLDSQP